MAYSIIWLPQAEEDFLQILEYLNATFGQSVSSRFKGKVERQLEIISNNPKIHRIYFWERKIRRSVVVRQISLYYLELEVEQEIIVIRLLDNRKDPTKIQEEIHLDFSID